MQHNIERELTENYWNHRYSEDEIINELQLNIDFIDFSTINKFSLDVIDSKHGLLDIAYFRRHCCVLELLLEKYYKFDSDILNKGRDEKIIPLICDLLDNCILIKNYDFVEICLKFISETNYNKYRKMFLSSAINNGIIRNGDIVELLRTHL